MTLSSFDDWYLNTWVLKLKKPFNLEDKDRLKQVYIKMTKGELL